MIPQSTLTEAFELQKHWAVAAKKHGVEPGPYSIREDGLIAYSPENQANIEPHGSVAIPIKKRPSGSSGSNK